MADPQYPSYRSVPSVLEFMQSMDQQRQDIQHSKADTQLLNIKVLMGQQEIAAQQQHQQAVEEYLRSERIAEAQGGPINQNNPMAPAVAGQPPSWWTPVDQSVKDLTVERNKFERQMSKATNLGLTDEVKTLRPLFDNTVTRLREASKEQATQRETQFKQTAQMLNSAKTAEQITTAMDYIKDKMPPEVWKKSDSMLLHNPDGSYLWNDQQAQRVATLGSMHTTVAEQNTDKYHDALLAGQAEERSRKILSDQERKNYHDARIAGGQSGVAGGAGPLKKIDYIYPKNEDGSADMSQGPIGFRGIGKDNNLMVFDSNNQPTTLEVLSGVTEKEGKISSGNAQQTQRAMLVQGAAKNALEILSEIRTKYPKDTTSVLFSMHPEGLTDTLAANAIRGTQNTRQQEVDSQWRAFIDEAIPVFTGGLRGSDAFRRFLISQAPNWGAKNNAQIMNLFERNIKGMDRAFANKAMTAYASEPKFWGTKDDGTPVTRADVSAAMQYLNSQAGPATSGSKQTGEATGAGNTSTVQTGAEPRISVNLKDVTPKEAQDLVTQLIKDSKNKAGGGTVAATPKADSSQNPDIAAKVTATGKKYEPDKYDYNVLPDGTVQRKPK